VQSFIAALQLGLKKCFGGKVDHRAGSEGMGGYRARQAHYSRSTPMSSKPKVALSQDFLLNLARLPAVIQGKVLKWAIRFQTDPTASGFNYEKIRAARDPHLRSVRIDGDWRGIVFVPPRSDLYILLYVDHHDEAYRWAENRKLTINPVTGAMQVVLVEEASAPPAPAASVVRERQTR